MAVACNLSERGLRLALFRQPRGFGIMCGMKKIEKEFEQVNAFVNRRWEQTVGFVNCQMLLTGWTVGAFVSARLKSSAWGSGTVDALVDYLKTRNPKLRGYGRRNIYNMVLFYDTYSAAEFKAAMRD